ncbi:hypothetical protein M5G25_15940 [Pseudomonas sp. TNT2022 ID357]|uniref:Transposase n=1 Tax=Pseudomonas idahonensis TaxID=2942628 RepID=A0ABT5Q706_9PSED|nr:hypothetical protein [Pseudomonas idahonensis]MDD1149785.1 hypothetical protein [Pseudomonas idahonensis]
MTALNAQLVGKSVGVMLHLNIEQVPLAFIAEYLNAWHIRSLIRLHAGPSTNSPQTHFSPARPRPSAARRKPMQAVIYAGLRNGARDQQIHDALIYKRVIEVAREFQLPRALSAQLRNASPTHLFSS